jgi:hypothetical protein
MVISKPDLRPHNSSGLCRLVQRNHHGRFADLHLDALGANLLRRAQHTRDVGLREAGRAAAHAILQMRSIFAIADEFLLLFGMTTKYASPRSDNKSCIDGPRNEYFSAVRRR